MVAVMVITTDLVSIVMLIVWQWHCLAVSALLCLLIAMEGVLLSAVLYKVPQSRSHLSAVITGAQTTFAVHRPVPSPDGGWKTSEQLNLFQDRLHQ